jgi:hypothetical protein
MTNIRVLYPESFNNMVETVTERERYKICYPINRELIKTVVIH